MPKEKSSDLIKDWARPTCQYWRVSCRGSLWGQKHWQWHFWWVIICMSPPGGCHFLPKTQHHPTACRLQCWDISGQTTNKAGTQPHPLADRLLKIFLSMALPTRGTGLISTHQWAEARPSHREACISLLDSIIHQRADSRSKKNYSPVACETENTITESQKK